MAPSSSRLAVYANVAANVAINVTKFVADALLRPQSGATRCRECPGCCAYGADGQSQLPSCGAREFGYVGSVGVPLSGTVSCLAAPRRTLPARFTDATVAATKPTKSESQDC